MSTSQGRAPGGAFLAVLRIRQFRRVLLGDAISSAGDVMSWVVLVVYLLDPDRGGTLVAAAAVTSGSVGLPDDVARPGAVEPADSTEKLP